VPVRRTSGPASSVLVQLMRSRQEALKNAFETATLYSHKGIIGSKREEGVRKFLRDHLPRNLDVVSGQAVDYLGTESGELDVMIYDSNLNAPFEGEGQVKLLPAEALLAIVEVKSRLDSKEWSKISKSVSKYVALKPYGESFAVRRSGRKATPDTLPRCFYSVVAFTSSLANSPGWARRELRLMAEAFGSSECLGLDRALILDRGVINPAGRRFRPNDDFGSNLFTWYVSLANFLNREVSRREGMDWQQYAGAEFATDWRNIVPPAQPGSIGNVRPLQV
jgi:hypothetical protein